MMTRLFEIEGIGERYCERLGGCGITTVEDLLALGATPEGRHELAERTHLREDLILKWIALADLFRIRGVAEDYAELLERVGITSLPTLAESNADQLYAELMQVNETCHVVRNIPHRYQVQSWVAQARELPRVVIY